MNSDCRRVSANKVRTLETQLDLAERKIREYRSQMEKSTSVFLGDNSEFMKMISSKENATDASFMGKAFASFNPILPAGLFHFYQLDEPIFNLRGVWFIFFFHFYYFF